MRALLVYYMVKHLHFAQGYASLVYGTYAAVVYLTPIAGRLRLRSLAGQARGAIVIGSITMAHRATSSWPSSRCSTSRWRRSPSATASSCPTCRARSADHERDDPAPRQSAYSIYYLGVQPRRVLRAARVRDARRALRLALRLRRRGHRHVRRARDLPAGSRYLPARTTSPESPQPARGDRRGRPARRPGAARRDGARGASCSAAAYEQSGNAMALWIDTGVDRSRASFAIPATWFQSLNPLFVFLLTPLVVAYWNRDKAPRAYRPGALRRMALGAFGVALVVPAALRRHRDQRAASLVHWAHRGRVLPAVHARRRSTSCRWG